jgi:hypothetical protein
MAKISFLFDGRKKKNTTTKSLLLKESVSRSASTTTRESDLYHTPSIEIKEITCMQPSTLNEEGRKGGRKGGGNPTNQVFLNHHH